MSLDEVRRRLIFRPVRDRFLEHFVFSVLPPLASTAHDALIRTSADQRAVVLYGDCFPAYRKAVIRLLGGTPPGEAQSAQDLIGAVTAYCNRFIQEFEDLSHEQYAKFLRNLIREDLIKPISYMLKVWLRWACDGPPSEREFGDILRQDLFPAVRDSWGDPNSSSVIDIPNLCSGWSVPVWLVANPDDEEAQYATADLTRRLQGELSSVVDAVLEQELSFGNGITALLAHAARESRQSFQRTTLDEGGKVELEESRPSRRAGRPKKKLAEIHNGAVLEVIRTSPRLRGEEYCQALDDRHIPIPFDWTSGEGCPKKYVEAYNHPDQKLRKKWRQRINDEKYRISKQLKAARVNS